MRKKKLFLQSGKQKEWTLVSLQLFQQVNTLEGSLSYKNGFAKGGQTCKNYFPIPNFLLSYGIKLALLLFPNICFLNTCFPMTPKGKFQGFPQSGIQDTPFGIGLEVDKSRFNALNLTLI